MCANASRRQGREFRRLQDDRITGSKRGSDFPSQHEQRKIPRDDLTDHAARDVTGEFLLEQLSQPAW